MELEMAAPIFRGASCETATFNGSYFQGLITYSHSEETTRKLQNTRTKEMMICTIALLVALTLHSILFIMHIASTKWPQATAGWECQAWSLARGRCSRRLVRRLVTWEVRYWKREKEKKLYIVTLTYEALPFCPSPLKGGGRDKLAKVRLKSAFASVRLGDLQELLVLRID